MTILRFMDNNHFEVREEKACKSKISVFFLFCTKSITLQKKCIAELSIKYLTRGRERMRKANAEIELTRQDLTSACVNSCCLHPSALQPLSLDTLEDFTLKNCLTIISRATTTDLKLKTIRAYDCSQLTVLHKVWITL